MASANPDEVSWPNPTSALTHIECLHKLCLFCHVKWNLQPLSLNLTKKITENSIIQDIAAPHIPRSICHYCRKDLSLDFKKNPDTPECLKRRRNATQPSVDQLMSYTLNGECNCGLCKKVRAKVPPPRKPKKRQGRPPKATKTLVCSKCYSEECDGTNCKTSNIKNSASNIIKSNPRVAQAVTSQVIKNTDPSPKGTIRLAQGSGGGELPLTLGSSSTKPKKMKVSSEQVNELRQKTGMGVKQTRQVTKFLNELGGRGTVESGHQEKIAKMTHKLDGHFALMEDCEFLVKGNKFVKEPLVYTKNLSDLVLCLTYGRGYNPHSTKVLLTVDNSEEFSEYSISIIDLEEDPDAKQKSSGSSHAILVAVSPKVPENHYNFKKVFELICTHEVELLYINDLKATLILIGNQSASCLHPCPFCLTDDLSKEGDARKIGTICEDNRKYLESGLGRSHLKEYNNSEFLPLVTNDYERDKDKEILDICPPPGLHIMLGVVNQDVKLLESKFPDQVNEWAKYSNAPRNPYHGGVFEGNGCKSLVDNVDYLQMLLEKAPNKDTDFALSIIDVLRKFKQVRHSCFGKELLPDYASDLHKYSEALDHLVSKHGVSIILKNHIAKYHVTKWCEKNQVGLGARSEQTAESVHKKFSRLWHERYKSLGMTKGQKLLKCLCAFNSDNAHFMNETVNCPHI